VLIASTLSRLELLPHSSFPWQAERRVSPGSRALANPPRVADFKIGMAEIKSESVAELIPDWVADFPRNPHLWWSSGMHNAS